MATRFWLVPNAMDGLAGVNAMETNVADETVNVADPDKVPLVAVMVVLPEVAAVARPVLVMGATPAFEDAQVTTDVKSCVEPSA